MNFKDALSLEHSKSLAQEIANIAAQKPSKLKELMECFFDDELRICQRSSWSVGLLGIKHSDLLVPYLRPMINHLENPKHDAVVRNTLRVWEEMNIPEEFEGEIFEIAFNYLVSPKNAVAIRAFSIALVAKIAKKYPDLKEEVLLEFIAQQEYAEKAAIRFRLKKYIKLLS